MLTSLALKGQPHVLTRIVREDSNWDNLKVRRRSITLVCYTYLKRFRATAMVTRRLRSINCIHHDS